MALSVLLIGAGGSLGTPLLAEFVRQKAKFSRIAVLASDPSKKAKFAEVKKNGVDVVVGSFLEASSYKGQTPSYPIFSFSRIPLSRAPWSYTKEHFGHLL